MTTPADRHAASADAARVTLYFDPCCPYAWLASRWLLEVESQSAIQLRFAVMSLEILNDVAPPDPQLRDPSGRLWVLARACAATAHTHGQHALRALYTALGQQLHNQGIKDLKVLRPALAAAGLPADLADSAWSTEHDDALRASHVEGLTPLGDVAGAPALHIDGHALFGPVLTGIPRGRQALDVFRAVRTLGETPQWAELKRHRTDALDFD